MSVEILDSWNGLLDDFQPAQKDIYFSEQYIRLYETAEERAVCFVCRDGEKLFLLPYLLRECIKIDGTPYYDFETAYGYGGAIYNTDNTEFITGAWKEFYRFAQENNYVAGFMRFHPLLHNEEYFSEIGRTINDRHTVAIDLGGSEEDIWAAEIHTKNRNVIKRGLRDGLTFTADYDFKRLPEFVGLYNATMDKLGADSFYYFDDKYYEKFKSSCPDSFLGVVEKDSQVIAAAIFFYSAPYGHYHLAGSDRAFLSLSPNNFLLWEAAKELRKHGVRLFHLGGGTDSDENNSLLQFKRKFSKQLYNFCIGKAIFNTEVYDKLCAEWVAANPDRAEKMKHILLKYKY